MILHLGALFPTFWGVLFLEQATLMSDKKVFVLLKFYIIVIK